MAYSEDKKSYTSSLGINPLAAGLMAAGDAISGIYGQRGNTYGNYLDALAKRQAAQWEMEKYKQENDPLAQINKTINTYGAFLSPEQMDRLLKQRTDLMSQSGQAVQPGVTAPAGVQPPGVQAPKPAGVQPTIMVPSGNPRQPFKTVANPDYVSKAKEDSAIRVATAKNQLPTADMKNALVGTQQFNTLMEDLKSQAYSLKGGYSGLAEQGKAILNRGAGKSADYMTYQDSLPSVAVSIYKGLTGDTKLSDANAKARALPLLWKPSEHPDVREKKFAFLERMGSARERLLSSGKYKPNDNGEVVIPLSDLKKEAMKGDSPLFKVGDTRMKDGVTYVRQKDGTWHPKS